MDNNIHIESETIALALIPPGKISDEWGLVRDRIEDACARSGGRFVTADILRFLIAGVMQLWVVTEGEEVRALGITEIVNYPQLKECRLIVCTGESREEWIHLIEKIEEWAMTLGCRKFIAITRPGWEKSLKGFDYKKTHVHLEKDLGYVH